MADIDFDSDDGYDLQSGTFLARFGPFSSCLFPTAAALFTLALQLVGRAP
jgi:hypothetical protein